MTSSFRISGQGRLNGAKAVQFSFDGKVVSGLGGDTVASALLANGIHLVGRSFKYHRPRGVFSAGVEEPNALIGVFRDEARNQPNVRATTQEIYSDLKTVSQNRKPSLSFDFGAVNDLFSPFFAAGFYYKTFMWPRAFWEKIYEPIIRKSSGFGESPRVADTDCYSNQYAHCEVLIIGGGASGIAAALSAANTGARIILCDEQPTFGGAFHHDIHSTIDGINGYDWAQASITKLRAMPNVTVLSRTTAFGYFAQNFVSLNERLSDHLAEPEIDKPRERLWQVRAKQVVIATGAIERHMVFSQNDRPGIMLASAARTYLNHYGVSIGHAIGVYTSCDSAYDAAFDLSAAGVQIVAIVDARASVSDALLKKAKAADIKVLVGYGVVGTKGRLRIKEMSVAQINRPEVTQTYAVDALIMSSGWTPSVHIFSQSRGKVRFDQESQRFLPGTYVQNCMSVGSCNGTDDLASAFKEAQIIGQKAAVFCGHKSSTLTACNVVDGAHWEGSHAGSITGPEKKAFVDFQHDVGAKDIRQAVNEGMHSIEHVKRFTTTGMATDQGKTSNIHGLTIAAEMLGKPIPEVGLTTFRNPYTPVTFGGLINHARGKLFDPTRKTAMHEAEVLQGAIFEDVGQWKRAWYYPQNGETMHEAVNRECKTTRDVAGVFDASTLGKIEVVGADAAKFLDILYTNGWQKLSVGRSKYGIMLREDGYIYDDGVIGRISDDRFHVTTTTGGAPRVLQHMEDYLQTEFPELDVFLTSTSEQWAVIAVQGPKAREIIAPFIDDIDISNDAFPHMSVREGHVCGVASRLFRISFTGELGFEINVPARFGHALWEKVSARAAEFGGCVYGTEAMHVLRAEKGYIIVGQDTDGTVTPYDAGVGWAVGKKKPDFVGIRGLKRPDLVASNRRELVGLRVRDNVTVLEEGAQIVEAPNQTIPIKMIGHVTSAYWSSCCNEPIALAIVENGHSRMGDILYVPMPDREIEIEICSPVFVDKEGGRLHG